YNTSSGKYFGPEKKQGYSATSTWSRGHGWAMYAYAAAYKQTKKASLLATARKVADYWMAHVPSDGVPYWDFASPDIPNTYRDTSAAAVAASGLLTLAKVETDAARAVNYRAAAKTILNSLASASYLAEGSTSQGVILHGAAYVPR